MTVPSMKLWTPSPIRMSGAAAACTVAVIVVAVAPQHGTSRTMKNTMMPPSSVPKTTGGFSDSSASGSSVEQRHAEQRADGVAHQPRHEAARDVLLEEQQRRGEQQAAEAAEDGKADGDEENGHGDESYQKTEFRSQNRTAAFGLLNSDCLQFLTMRRIPAAPGRCTSGSSLRRGCCASGRPSVPRPDTRGCTGGSARRRRGPSPDRGPARCRMTSVRPPLSSVISRSAASLTRSSASHAAGHLRRRRRAGVPRLALRKRPGNLRRRAPRRLGACARSRRRRRCRSRTPAPRTRG